MVELALPALLKAFAPTVERRGNPPVIVTVPLNAMKASSPMLANTNPPSSSILELALLADLKALTPIYERREKFPMILNVPVNV